MNKVTIVLLMLISLAACSKSENSKTGGNSSDDKYSSADTTANSRNTQPIPERGELVRAAKGGKIERVIDLLKRGANINEYVGNEQDQLTPLMAAIISYNIDIAIYLIRHDALIYPTYKGYSAKDFAFYHRQYEIVDLINSKELTQ